MSVPVKGEAYTFYLTLVSVAASNTFQVNPTIASGDFQVSIDGGAFTNLSTIPVVSPAGSVGVLVSLSATEMDGDKLQVVGVDASGAEWLDVAAFLDVPAGSEETVVDILEGDHTESFDRLTIKKKSTQIVLVDKQISGSLLSTQVIISTSEP